MTTHPAAAMAKLNEGSGTEVPTHAAGDTAAPAAAGREVCRKFYRRGHCYNAKCKFWHTLDVAPAKPAGNAGSSASAGQKRSFDAMQEVGGGGADAGADGAGDGEGDAAALEAHRKHREHKHRQRARKQQRHVEECWRVAVAAGRRLLEGEGDPTAAPTRGGAPSSPVAIQGEAERAAAATASNPTTPADDDIATALQFQKWFSPPPPVHSALAGAPPRVPVAWSSLPAPCAMPTGFTPVRRQRKEWQVENFAHMIVRVAGIMQENALPRRMGTGEGGGAPPRITVADLGSGSGNVSLPLAAAYPHIDFILLDMKPSACRLAEQRARNARLANVKVVCGKIEDVRWVGGDVYARGGMHASSSPSSSSSPVGDKDRAGGAVAVDAQRILPCDIVLALHCCGIASDLAQLAAFAARAAFVLCPCCLGKIQQFSRDERRRDGVPAFPRSAALTRVCGAADFAQIAALADHPTTVDAADGDGAAACAHDDPAARARAACKTLVERDRQLAARDRGYQTVLTKLTPLEASPKHDVIVGVPGDVTVSLEEVLYR